MIKQLELELELGPKRIELTSGALRFGALAAGRGPVVLCLHGFPDHNRSFRHQLPALVAAGYRVVCPNLRGYEPRSQPADGDYHVVRLAEDVLAWLDQLDAPRVHLVGHDWGAVIAYAVATLAPRRLITLTTLAIPHLRHGLAALRARPVQLWRSSYMLFHQLGPVAERVGAARDFAYVRWLWRRWSPGWEPEPAELEQVVETLRQPGVFAASLAYYQALLRAWRPGGRASLRALTRSIHVPTLALTGARDGCMDTRLHDVAMRPADFPAGLRVERVAAAGHFLHQERPAEVNRLLLAHLAGPR